jgi:copper chaperone NosL
VVLVCFLGAARCASGPEPPAALDVLHTTCSSCRMPVSDRRLAAQIVAAGEEPRFFDDFACLERFLDAQRPAGVAVYVTDHRTGEWVRASKAVFSRVDARETPMGSHLIAHADAASRDADGLGGAIVAVGAPAVLDKGGR